ncbi:hypothetical protein VVD49_21185 [Uliginosibacterium sp. H3]|uniref:Toxin CptA n=1 Tax=Uliginosibacterium silvisoli TaxID=3114758 RepID=A0ABU6KBD2_9RHOO|nr:hypothetical protein [Uliginosibacterium sp. H3]
MSVAGEPAANKLANKYPSRISLARSSALWLAIGLVHLMPLASMLGAGVPLWVRCLVIVLCLVSIQRELRTARRLREASLRPHAEGAQLLVGERVFEGRVLPTSVDMGPLLILHWQAEMGGRQRRFALLRDAFSAEEWRVMKLWLHWSVMSQSAQSV